MKLKPKAYSMSIGGYEIIYTCATHNCNFRFKMATDDWHFCPKCGAEIDWGVITRANEEWKQSFFAALDNEEKKSKILDALDLTNSYIHDERRHEMVKTKATTTAITHSNIQYYLGIGWTKEQLLAKGWFKEEDFDE